MLESFGIGIKGHIKIIDVVTQEILVDKDNQIHFENFSIALAQSLASGSLNAASSTGFIYSMGFGNGGTSVSSTGVVTYNPPNVIGIAASLYNQTYSKVVNNNFSADLDTINNNIVVNHIVGKAYSDLLISCRLNFGEPAGQDAFDNTSDYSGEYVFDELGILGTTGQLLTHVIFNPIQKSLNRLVDIDYSLRIQTLGTLPR